RWSSNAPSDAFNAALQPVGQQNGMQPGNFDAAKAQLHRTVNALGSGAQQNIVCMLELYLMHRHSGLSWAGKRPVVLAPLALPPGAHGSQQQQAPAQDRNTIRTQWQPARFDQAPAAGSQSPGVLQDAQTPVSTPTHASHAAMSHPALGPGSGSNKTAAQLLKERILAMHMGAHSWPGEGAAGAAGGKAKWQGDSADQGQAPASSEQSKRLKAEPDAVTAAEEPRPSQDAAGAATLDSAAETCQTQKHGTAANGGGAADRGAQQQDARAPAAMEQPHGSQSTAAELPDAESYWAKLESMDAQPAPTDGDAAAPVQAQPPAPSLHENGADAVAPTAAIPSQQHPALDTPPEAPTANGVDARDEVEQGSNAEFDEHLKDVMKDRGDKFDDMVEHEERIRLGETGWKARYYQVQARTASPARVSQPFVHQPASPQACFEDAGLTSHSIIFLAPVPGVKCQGLEQEMEAHARMVGQQYDFT
ncbi:hypothetical protein MMC29_005230, partial [Sticta canariensis]|nr:hypothetical protein [Sticta canariensis]